MGSSKVVVVREEQKRSREPQRGPVKLWVLCRAPLESHPRQSQVPVGTCPVPCGACSIHEAHVGRAGTSCPAGRLLRLHVTPKTQENARAAGKTASSCGHHSGVWGMTPGASCHLTAPDPSPSSQDLSEGAGPALHWPLPVLLQERGVLPRPPTLGCCSADVPSACPRQYLCT